MKTGEKSIEHQRVISSEVLQEIEKLADSIRYGSISLVFQDGTLVQIEKNEKFRISPK